MANDKQKRKALFYRFAEHLNLLKANGFLKGTTLKYDFTYICPLCLEQFSKADLEPSSPNMLTIEHAPPESAGGQGVALTCKRCNSIAGHVIDFHLTERLLEIERRKFLPNTTSRVRATNNGLTVQATMRVEADGKTMKMTHSPKDNNVAKIEDFAKNVNPTDNPLIELEHRPSRTSFRGFEIGLLKTAYILAFAKFGYSFILDEVFDIVRKQLAQPEIDVYPEHFWLKEHPIFPRYKGVHFCTTPVAECLFSIFQLSPSERSYYYGVCLPIPLASPRTPIEYLYSIRHGGELTFDQMDPRTEFLFDLQQIQNLKDWFFRVRMTKIGLNHFQNVEMALLRLRYPIGRFIHKKRV
jgi:hypothetical protein